MSRGQAGSVASVVCPSLSWCLWAGGMQSTLLLLPTLQKQKFFCFVLYLVGDE